MKNRTEVFLSTIPGQHGAWSVLIACFLIGTLSSGGFNPISAIFLISLLSAFLGRHTLSESLKLPALSSDKKKLLSWFEVYLAVFIITGVVLVWGFGRWLLIPLGLVSFLIMALSLYIDMQDKGFSLSGQISGIFGLSLVVPSAEYATSGVYSLRTFGLWIVCLLFFMGSVFYVRYLVRRRQEASGPLLKRLKAGIHPLIFHLTMFLVSMGLAKAEILPSLIPLALVPANLKVLRSIGCGYKKPPAIRQIGLREFFHILVFLLIVVVVFRIQRVPLVPSAIKVF